MIEVEAVGQDTRNVYQTGILTDLFAIFYGIRVYDEATRTTNFYMSNSIVSSEEYIKYLLLSLLALTEQDYQSLLEGADGRRIPITEEIDENMSNGDDQLQHGSSQQNNRVGVTTRSMTGGGGNFNRDGGETHHQLTLSWKALEEEELYNAEVTRLLKWECKYFGQKYLDKENLQANICF